MFSPLRVGLITLVVLGGAEVPCYAQHMNAPGAPCQTAPNAEAGRCFSLAAERADRELNDAYGQIRDSLSTADKAELDAAERLWIKYRDAACLAEKHLYGAGTGANPAYSACVEAETSLRLADLNLAYGWKVTKTLR